MSSAAFSEPVPAPAPRIYCTHFDSRYLARGIAMLRSLRRFDARAPIHVLALDEQCAKILAGIFGSSVSLITTDTLHQRYPELRGLREGRSQWAYYATQKPAFAVHTIEHAPPSSIVAFIDADTWFFADPRPMFAEFGASSIGLSPHRFPQELQHLAMYGQYNAGCNLWRADMEGLRCARNWANDCVERCDEQCEGGHFMNQGYLNHWPERYSGVHLLRHPGVNLAPWNLDNHVLAPDGAGIAVDDQPLIFFHFSGIVPAEDGSWRSIYPHRRRQLEFLRESIYGPYLAAVETERRMLRESYSTDGIGSVRADLAAGPGVMRFHSTANAEVDLEAFRRATRRLVDAGMFEAALILLQTAGPPLHGGREEWEYYIAFCLQSLNREPETALCHYNAAQQLGYDEFWVCYHRGQLLLTIGRRPEGLLDLNRALDLRPEHEGLPELLERAQS